MPDINITGLTNYADPKSTDVLPVVDVTADVTKKVTVDKILKNATPGTAADPGITFDGRATNTGIYSPAEYQIGLATNGVSRLFIDLNGNVGLSNTSPTNRLDVAGNINISTGSSYRINGTEVLSATALGSAIQISSANIPNGTIIDSDISATAEIAVSKLADGAARQLLQTDAAGTGVEWADNIDIPGTLDVTGAATFDSSVTVTGNLTVNGTTTTINSTTLTVDDKNIELASIASPTDVLADGGGITLKGTTDKTILWSNSTASWQFNQPVISTGASTATAFVPTGSTVPANGIYLQSANQIGISTNSVGRLIIDSNGRVGVNTTSATAYSMDLAVVGTVGLIPSTQNTVGSTVYIKSQLGSTGGEDFIKNEITGFVNSGNYGTAISFATRATTTSTERLRITSAGDVGIGTSSPGGRLTVQSAADAIGFRTETGSSSPRFTINNNSSGAIVDFYDNAGNIKNRIDARANFASYFTAGNVGIGTTGPSTALHVVQSSGNGEIALDSPAATSILSLLSNAAGTSVLGYSQQLRIGSVTGTGAAGFTERVRIDSSGRLLVGTSTSVNYGAEPKVQIVDSGIGLSIQRPNNEAVIVLGNSGTVNSSSNLSILNFTGYDGANYLSAATIRAQVDGTPGTNDMPGRLVFATTADGAATPTERLRIDSSGRLLVGTFNWYTIPDSVFANGWSQGQQIKITDTSGAYGGLAIISASNAANQRVADISLNRQNGSTDYAALSSGSPIGSVTFNGADGTAFVRAASIQAYVDGAPGTNDMPGRLVFATTADGASSPTEAMRINNQRELLIGTTTRTANGGVLQVSNGITFPGTQSACSDPNTLDDYEEGTFTPIIEGTTTAGAGTYSAQVGRYVKIGKTVTVWIRLTWSAHTGTGNGAIASLPFTSQTISGGHHPFAASVGYETNYDVSANTVLSAYVEPNGTRIFFAQIGVGTQSGAGAAALDTAAGVTVSATYETA